MVCVFIVLPHSYSRLPPMWHITYATVPNLLQQWVSPRVKELIIVYRNLSTLMWLYELHVL